MVFAMSSRTVYTVLEETVAHEPDAPALYQPGGSGNGKYKVYTWREYRDIVREIAVGLRSLGIGRGDIVAVFSETRAEFYLADIGIMSNGSISAALYTSYPMPDQVRNLRVAEPKAIIVENVKSMEALQAAGDGSLAARWILIAGSAGGAMTLDDVRAAGRRLMADRPDIFEHIQDEYAPADPAILYLTSGATGEPKMGLVTHAAVVGNIDTAPLILPVGPKDRTIVFLPSAHIAQRVVLELVPLRMGTPVWFSESLSKLPSELKSVRPTFLLAPPRVWERVYASIGTEIRKRSGVARKLFGVAVGVGSEASRRRQDGKPVPGWMRGSLKLFDRLVYTKIRERLGGKLRIAASGAAPLSKELADFFSAIGMPLIEGYGLTEGGVVSFNPLNRPKPGSIGTPLPNMEVRIAEDGELLVKGPSLFSGYFKDPDATAAVLRDGWLYTGDIAEMDSEGYLYITGRKKELIVSSNGKKIYPSRIENLFKAEPLVNQVVLIGDKMPYVTALFTVNPQAAEGLKGMHEFQGRGVSEIAKAGPVAAELQQAVNRVNKKLASFEQVRKFRILERDFTIEDGELTPTMKIRRNRVLENHRALVSELYMGKEID
jgi:long-chain acyl-CoA synthetase